MTYNNSWVPISWPTFFTIENEKQVVRKNELPCYAANVLFNVINSCSRGFERG